jgi:hypothetical protein
VNKSRGALHSSIDGARSASASPDKYDIESMKAASAKAAPKSQADSHHAQPASDAHSQQKKPGEKEAHQVDHEALEKHKQQMIAEVQQKQVFFLLL